MDEARRGIPISFWPSPVRAEVRGEFGGRELLGVGCWEPEWSSLSLGSSGSLPLIHLFLHVMSRRMEGRRSLKLRCRPEKCRQIVENWFIVRCGDYCNCKCITFGCVCYLVFLVTQLIKQLLLNQLHSFAKGHTYMFKNRYIQKYTKSNPCLLNITIEESISVKYRMSH